MAKFLIQKSTNGKYYFVLKANNSETILTSEMYTQIHSLKNWIQSVRENSYDDSHYNRLISMDNKYYFTLEAENGEVIGVSETYNSKQAMENGIQSVKENAPLASIESEI